MQCFLHRSYEALAAAKEWYSGLFAFVLDLDRVPELDEETLLDPDKRAVAIEEVKLSQVGQAG